MTATAARQVFRLPDLGEGLTEAEIVEWKVAVGDTVEIDQIVVEVETAKAAVEVPVPYAGTVLRLHAEAGAVVAVGEPLIEVGDSQADPAAARYREEERAGSGNVLIGYGTTGTPHKSRRRPRLPKPTPSTPTPAPAPGSAPAPALGSVPAPASEAAPAPAAGSVPAPASGSVAGTAPAPARGPASGSASAPGRASGTEPAPPSQGGPERAPRVISPLVRRMAREHGVDLAAVLPTGPHGVILRRDVEHAIANPGADSGATSEALSADQAASPAAPASPVALASPVAPVAERIPLRGLRRTVADKLTRSRTEIPDATTWVDVDATDLLTIRDTLRRTSPDLGIGLLALLARACVAGLLRFPELNSSVDTDRAEIVRHGHINLGFAAQTERGLVVPVVRDAHLMTTAGLAAELTRLTALARSGGLPPSALTGGTFTLNNYGVFGVDGSTPIINHPEAALLGVGRVIDRPWVHDGAVVPRKITQLSLTFDHRVCDGGAAGGFLRFVADCVENPAVLLAHV
ncbi:dihydrolipoamide acetyltransferase family protein [Nonomuraea sp. NPDC049758]|uniref:dihydrolipoamide acetyltransferase family protein n=1 Tax=Nonomuraea sp. NPDC049758 TaxID=3154360 RepID=UPI0034361891